MSISRFFERNTDDANNMLEYSQVNKNIFNSLYTCILNMNKILESTKFVVDNSQHVKINSKRIDDFCKYFTQKHIKHWFIEAPFDIRKLNPKDKLHFILALDSMSFSYWGEPKWTIRYQSKEINGGYGMIAAIGRAIENNMPVLDAKYMSTISEPDFSRIFEGNTQIPLFKERLEILRDIGNTLIKKFDGDFSNVIRKADGDALKLLSLIVENFPSFEDSTVYKGKKVYFYKRAQLLVSDIYQAFDGQGHGKLKNIDQLTACADYKLPLVLRRLGIFEYSDDLAHKIDNKILIEKGSLEEIEIRANTIWAVELLKQKIKAKIPNVDSIHINDHLWMLGQEKLKKDKPYHLTRTTAY